MKSLTEHLWFEVPNRRRFVNVTGTVEDPVRKSGVKEGLCLVNAMHITASNPVSDRSSRRWPSRSGSRNDWLRRGNTACVNGAAPFLRATRAQMPSHIPRIPRSITVIFDQLKAGRLHL
jgi:hypothetical protein